MLTRATGVMAAFLALFAGALIMRAQDLDTNTLTLSVVSTNDVHGAVFERDGRGGVGVLAGYVNNLRARRAEDGGAVLLIDAGDTYQGTVESNLSEGAVVVDAYNAMGYTAAAIGNHEFDFGAVDSFGVRPARHAVDDSRGALKAIAARARFPVLTANLMDEATGRPVEWPNVKPSVLVDAAGVRVGIVGVMTAGALRATLAVNTGGLRVAPLVPAIAAEASRLRQNGADVVIVAAHAGGSCARFDVPADLSSCDDSSEIFFVARQLPRGLVDLIVAGHTHAGVAHVVDGIGIIEAFAGGRAFGRADIVVERATKHVSSIRLFAPQDLLATAEYEGKAVVADAAIAAAMASALKGVRDLRAIPLGPILETAVGRSGDWESPLGNLFADALRGSVAGADVGITNNNSIGGLRADLREGPLTFGAVYDVFPFDNRLVGVMVTGEQLARLFVQEMRRGRRGGLGVSGVRVSASCRADGPGVDLHRASGESIGSSELLKVATTDFITSGAFALLTQPGGFQVPHDAPIAIDAIANWLRRQPGPLTASQFIEPERRRWEVSPSIGECLSR
jgi:2',3'-cyclic-nucleotide 2'-phosphodiesterase (5'-nucleotidase family)